MIWGCMSQSRPGAVAQVVGRMDSEQCIEISGTKLTQSMYTTCLLGDMPFQEVIIFQQDGGPNYTSWAA